MSDALSAYLHDRDEDASTLGAEVPMAKHRVRQANNHFGNVGVGLYPQLSFDAAGGSDRRRTAASVGAAPNTRRSRRATGHWPRYRRRCCVGVSGNSTPTVRSPVVIGNTVVSSVDRGPADLTFGGRPVVLTASYPALSPMMALTHGVNGIGNTIAISVHAAESAVADVDEYLQRLAAAL